MLFSLIIPCYNENKNLPYLFNRLDNVLKNNLFEVVIVENGSNDESYETIKKYSLKYKNLKYIKLDINEGYGNARIINDKRTTAITVQIVTLLELMKKHNIDYITNLKIDVEGYEDRALKPFFESAPKTLFPKNIVIEYTSQHEWGDKDFVNYLMKKGYRLKMRTRGNLCLSLNTNNP